MGTTDVAVREEDQSPAGPDEPSAGLGAEVDFWDTKSKGVTGVSVWSLR